MRCFAGLVLLWVGCTAASPDTVPCHFASADGGLISEQAARTIIGGAGSSTTKRFIVLGAPDCERHVCVRDATVDGGELLDAPAVGYCSQGCGSDADCPRGASAPAMTCDVVSDASKVCVRAL